MQKLLDEVRTHVPSKKTIAKLNYRKKAWKGSKPTKEDMKRIATTLPHTHIVTYTKQGAAEVNELTVKGLYGKKKPLATLDGDYEMNPDNYVKNRLKTDVSSLRPCRIPIYKGMRLYLTQNVQKEAAFVNGMQCKVEGISESGVLRVRTKTGKRVFVTPWTDVEHGNMVYYPIRLGYAVNIHKVQGDEFKHMILYPDVDRPMPAAGYVALSRVKSMDSVLIGGTAKRIHFVPATHKDRCLYD